MVPMSSAPHLPRIQEALVGTHVVLASTIRLSPGPTLSFYVLIWAACVAGVGVVSWAALRSRRFARGSTQDILIVAALGVPREVSATITGAQFTNPVPSPIPGAEFLQLHDLPYL